MDTTPVRVRWLVAGAVLPSPSGRRFLLTEASFAEQFRHAASGLNVTIRDRLGSGDASSHTLSFDSLEAFQLSAVIDALPDLRTLRAVCEALSNARGMGPQDAARLEQGLGPGLLTSALADALRNTSSPQQARDAALAIIEEALFSTARDILQHPRVARLESTWRGLHWLWTHCPASAGMDIEVLDVEPHQLVDALTRSIDVPALQRPDACFLLDPIDDVETLHRLAALGEQACLPLVVAVQEAHTSEAWNRLRANEASRWLCAAQNRVVMMAEQHGEVHRECFTSPALAMAALLAASFRDTRTFGRLVGPGSGTRAPAVWRPGGRSPVATEVGLSLREQQQLAARGVGGVGGWWDTNAVLLTAAPTVYGGRDATPLPAQLLTGRIVRLAEEIAERLPAGASQDAVSAVFSRAAEAFLPTGGVGRACQLQGKVVPTGNGGRAVQVFAALRPELAGTHVQLEFTLPLRG